VSAVDVLVTATLRCGLDVVVARRRPHVDAWRQAYARSRGLIDPRAVQKCLGPDHGSESMATSKATDEGRDTGPESRATSVEAVADLLGMTPADVRSAIATMQSDGRMNSLTGSTAVCRGRARC